MTPRLASAQLQTEGATSQPMLPIATITIVAITAVVTSLQWFYPALLPMLDRNQAALLAGQWWRLVTPRLVQPEIWPQYVLLAILAVVGTAVEQRLGSLRWLTVWLVGGVIGEMISYRWQPQGAGASLGLFALIGAWLVLLLRRNPAGPWWAAGLLGGLILIAVRDQHGPPLFAGAAVVAILVAVAQR